MITRPTFDEEKKLWKKGYTVIGIDEVGRGAFAGPVVAAAVVFSIRHPEALAKGSHEILLGQLTHQNDNIIIDDSKRLNPKQRRDAAIWIKKNCLSFSVAEVGLSTINKHGIGIATQIAFRKTLNLLRFDDSNHRSKKRFVLIDGFHVKYLKGFGLKNQKAIIKGDQKSISIAAASVIAKVYRDNLMIKLHKRYPLYGFAKHKGYGTKKHQEAIKKLGLSKLHRTSFNLN